MENNKETKILEQIRTTRGFVESFHRVLAKEDPKTLEIMFNLWNNTITANSLGNKETALIRLAVVSILRDETAISHSIDQAIDAGSNYTEIIDALKIAAYFGGVLVLVDSLKILEKKLKNK